MTLTQAVENTDIEQLKALRAAGKKPNSEDCSLRYEFHWAISGEFALWFNRGNRSVLPDQTAGVLLMLSS